MKYLIAIVLSALMTSNVYAWGDKEQGVVAGVLGTIIVQEVFKTKEEPAVVIRRHAPEVIYRDYERELGAYERGLRDRYRDDLLRIEQDYRIAKERARQRAYLCGRFGECE
jgi:hypothetical protein